MKRVKSIIKFTSLIIFILLISYLNVYSFYNKEYYKKVLESKTSKTSIGSVAPRGRILDRNGIVLVDNKITNNLVFHYNKKTNMIEVAKELASNFEFKKPTENECIKWYKASKGINNLLTKKEEKLFEERKISVKEREKLINKKIKAIIISYTDYDKNCAKAYSLMNNGLIYEDKIIKYDLTDKQVNKIIDLNISSLSIQNGYKRVYTYEDTLKTILGNLNEKGEAQSYLESYYDDYLKGKPAKYMVNEDYSYTKIKDEVPGNDLYLSIDINLQQNVDRLVKENLQVAKNKTNTQFLTDTYAILSNPSTGEILAIVGERYLDNKSFNDITENTISSSFTLGSVVKGATISVGYKYNLIDPNKKILDGCVKLYSLTEKCSYERLGYIDAVTALEKSSNYYQFLIAIALAGSTYIPNMNLNVSKKQFDIYRQMLASYGLGIQTGIDLPNEKIGLIGEKATSDLLLNLAIGQYDTYTPIELANYINTIASSGKRRSPSLVNSIKDVKGNVIFENKHEVKNTVTLKQEDFDKIHEGFYRVMNFGTGLGFFHKEIKAAGKTGTSESFLDTNNDGIIDTSTISLTLASYFPYDNPKYSLILISPHVSHYNSNEYVYYITAKLSREITDFMFENNMIT